MLPLGSEAKVQEPSHEVISASTDMGDVSWNVPTVQLTAATWVPGTPAHSWQAVASGGTSIGAKGMMVAAKTMALTVAELFGNADHVTKARAEFVRRLGDHQYKSRLAGSKPMLDYRR
jgi:aminobenzoyl-glutamate utilization protein B